MFYDFISSFFLLSFIFHLADLSNTQDCFKLHSTRLEDRVSNFAYCYG